MELRALLQTEIWSKRTSRKLMVGFGIIGVAIAVWYQTDRHWLTPGERNAGRQAFSSIEALQSFGTMNDNEYETRISEARGKVDAAKQAVWTSRDRSIARVLDGYLMLTDMERSDQKLWAELSGSTNQRVKVALSRNPQAAQTSQMVRDFQKQLLHQALEQ
jgi:hypothetical protein